jgi:hypothetical protein
MIVLETDFRSVWGFLTFGFLYFFGVELIYLPVHSFYLFAIKLCTFTLRAFPIFSIITYEFCRHFLHLFAIKPVVYIMQLPDKYDTWGSRTNS